MATIASPGARWRNDRLFYTGMGVAVALTVFAGFAQTFYLARWLEAPPTTPEMTVLLWLHGFVFTAWIALLVAQPALVAARNLRLHRKLGYAGMGVAAAMVLFGNLAAVAAMEGGFKGLGDPRVFYAVPFFAINTFAPVAFLAYRWRLSSETHKRLILLSNVPLIGAAIARIPLGPLQAGAPFTFIFLPNLITLAGIAYDLVSRGRVHRVWIWGGLAMLATQVLMMAVMGTSGWMAFARFMDGLW